MRKYEIDHIRVIAFLILIFYHTGMFFVPWEFHLKNNVVSTAFELPMLFFNQWRLSLLFLVSGMGTYFSISKRNAGGFVSERFRRLMVPFIFGMLVIVPPQVYYERMADGVINVSYWQYYLHDAFKGVYPEGNISWHHLWFILYLFIFSVVLVALKKGADYLIDKGERGGLFAKGWIVLLGVTVPIFLSEYFLRIPYPPTNGLISDWFNLARYLWVFVCGYLFARAMKESWPMFRRMKYSTLCLGIVGFTCLYIFPVTDSFLWRSALRALNMWCWMFAIVGFAIDYLNKGSKWLSYANEAVYPFYILHQTVILAICYYVRNLEMSIFTKLLIIAGGTTLICWVLYEFLIRRIKVLRVLFGMRPDPRSCEKKE